MRHLIIELVQAAIIAALIGGPLLYYIWVHP
jgi:hypothetical protein